jgi:NADH:ubiquinone reductase (H+-translocating)
LIDYDYLILATGAKDSYFGHPEFEQFAPGLKSLADAESIRNKILSAFEDAEIEEDPLCRRDYLTFVLVGAGPTGVEMASAIADLAHTSRNRFRRFDSATTRILLVDMASRVLGTFSESLSIAAQSRLQQLGVEVLLGHGVDAIDATGVTIGGNISQARM